MNFSVEYEEVEKRETPLHTKSLSERGRICVLLSAYFFFEDIPFAFQNVAQEQENDFGRVRCAKKTILGE